MKKGVVVGLTGGIASGKSLALNHFRKLGAKTFDSDVLARKVVRQGLPAYGKIVKQFGEEILLKNRNIDRKRLGGIVFSNPKKRKLLERIIHPDVIKDLKRAITSSATDILVIDIPLLYEAHLESLVDKVVVIWAPLNKQMERLKDRNHFTPAQALARIKSQLSLKNKCRRADFVVDNSSTVLKTKSQISKIFSLLTKN